MDTIQYLRTDKLTLHGKFLLPLIIFINTCGVVLMLHSNAGVPAISGFTYALSSVFPFFSLGVWTYIFQSILVVSLMMLKKKFIPQYFFSFIVGFFFSLMVDFHQLWIVTLPNSMALNIAYYFTAYFMICLGIALSNRCHMPIIPTDLFPRELSGIIEVSFSRVKTTFDISCLIISFVLTFMFSGNIGGIGIGTLFGALTMGHTVNAIETWLDQRVTFRS